MSKKDDLLIWTPKNYSQLYKTRVFNVNEVLSVSPEGAEKKFIKLNAPEWVIVVPVINISGSNMEGSKQIESGDYFIMVKQWRHGSETICTEFPGGVVDPEESPFEAAKRELYEETGKEVLKIKLLASLYPNPAIMENKCHIFLAECSEKTGKRNLDEDEFLSVLKLPVTDVIKNMGKPPYDHALMNAALMLYLKETGMV